ncbi:hypothetical protein H4S08_000044 [Coemansia sp. RSA 1365]|nr:hypothetical protein H4S08_000044 [Coemansia sp. RSA 1365]
MDAQTESSALPSASTKAPLMDTVEQPPVAFDLGSSLLQGAFSTDNFASDKSAPTTRYDPVAQLMESDDSDNDSDDLQNSGSNRVRSDNSIANIPQNLSADMVERNSPRLDADSKVSNRKLQKPRKPLNAARFKLDKNVKKDSVVGRMAAAHRARNISSDTSDDSDHEGDRPDIRKRTTSKTTRHRSASDTNSDSEPEAKQTELSDDDLEGLGLNTKKPGDKAPKSSSVNPDSKNKGRAASKAAMVKIHQESERLVRETAVNIDPEEFTQRLALDDFFNRFDTRSREPSTKKPRKAFVVPPVQTKGTFTFKMDDGSNELVVVEDDYPMLQSHTAVGVFKSIHQTQVKPLVHENALDAILSHGSQPLHISEAQSTGHQRTGGPLALRDLNTALLDVMYKKDVESRLAAAEKKAKKQRDKAERLERSTQSQIEQTEVEDDQDEIQMDSDNNDGESAAEEFEDEPIARGKRHTTAVYDDDDPTGKEERNAGSASSTPLHAQDDASNHADTKIMPPLTAATKVPASKNKFVSMFRMPVREVAISPEKMAAKTTQIGDSPEHETPSQQDSVMPISQDLPDLFSSQIGALDTQDSLLMTPDVETQRNQQSFSLDVYSDELRLLPATQQQSQVLSRPNQIMSTRPTQLTNPTQPLDADDDARQTQQTPLTVSTVATADASTSSTAMLPTMVRRALDADGSEHDSDDVRDEAMSDAGLQQPDSLEPDEEQAEPVTPAKVHKQGRLLRRRGASRGESDTVHAKTKRIKRSEFVEAEAEEGESSDSEGESKTIKHRKFNWGNDKTKQAADSEDEEDLDMDTDEEEAALLADPMIDDNVEEDGSGDEAIRDLHRQRDFDEDEKDIQNLFRDVTTGRLRNRNARDKTGLGLADEEDYNDRQTRAERMEERLRMRRKLLAREIHDSNLAEIARDPETAAFAQAALMRRAPTADGRADSTDAEDEVLSDGAFELEEEVDDHNIATTVQKHLARQRMRIDSDVESDSEDSRAATEKSKGNVSWRAAGRVASGNGDSQSSIFEESMVDDSLGSDVFSPVEIEKLIVRRRTLMTTETNQGAASKHIVVEENWCINGGSKH